MPTALSGVVAAGSERGELTRRWSDVVMVALRDLPGFSFHCGTVVKELI